MSEGLSAGFRGLGMIFGRYLRPVFCWKRGVAADFLPDTTHFDLKCHEIRLFWGVIGVKTPCTPHEKSDQKFKQTKQSKKSEKFWKKVLTFGKQSYIIWIRRVRDKRFGKLLTRLEGTKEKSLKKLQKSSWQTRNDMIIYQTLLRNSDNKEPW